MQVLSSKLHYTKCEMTTSQNMSPLSNPQTNQFGNHSSHGKKPTMPNAPIRVNSNPLGPWANSDEEKAELFARHLSEVFTPHDNSFDPEVENKLTNLNKPQEKLSAFTILELNQVIKRLHPHKAPGPDNITAQMLQELPIPGLKVLLYILNAILRLEYWPKTFKIAKVIIVLKLAKPPTDVASYRPISLLPIISKILETLLLNRITKETHLQDWVPEHRFGFRKAHSTIQQCHRLSDSTNKELEEQEFCSAVFLDISQAFDKVWHPGLLFKIDQTLPPRFYNILNPIYSSVNW